MTLYKIANWDKYYENHRSRDLKYMDWVPVRTKMDGDGYTELVSHRDGAAHLGVWVMLLLLASKFEPRGSLQRSCGTPHDFTSMSRITRASSRTIRAAITRLVGIGWLLAEEVNSMETVADISTDGSESHTQIPHTIAEKRGIIAGSSVPFRSVPFRSVPAREIADDFPRFLEACDLADMGGSETDLRAARFEWERLPLEERLAACAGIKDRVAAGELADPGFRPLPQNYLKNKIWQRPVREKREPAMEKHKIHRTQVAQLTKVFGEMK